MSSKPRTDAPVVFADSETDGVHPGRKPWEVAMIRREPDGQEKAVRFFVDIDLSTADPFGLKIGGFYDRHPLGQWVAGARHGHRPRVDALLYIGEKGPDMVSRHEAAGLIAQFTHGAHVVGAIPSFDTFTFEPLLHEAGLTPSWHHHIIDVEALAVGFLNGRYLMRELMENGVNDPRLPIRPPYDSDTLSHMVGVDPAQYARHEALADAQWARAIYDVCVPARAHAGVEAARA